MRKVMKLFSALTVLILGLLVASGVVSAAIAITDVELDDDSLGDGTNIIRDVQRGDEFEVKVHAISDSDIDDVQVEAYIRGYDHNDVMQDISDVFDMKAGVTYVKTLTLKFRERMDQDRYQLRVRVEGRSGADTYNDYDIEVDAGRHEIVIRDIIVSPENEIKAGRALLTSVRLKNYGEKDEDGVKVIVSIPELGISASDYIDEIESEDSVTSEEIYLRIPANTKSGEYTIEVEVEYDDGDELVADETSIYVIGDENTGSSSSSSTGQKTIITIGPDVQDVKRGGAGVVYPVTITNAASTSKVYTISVDGGSWASFRVSPSNVLVISSGESQAAYIFVSAEEDTPLGENIFTVTIKSGDKVLQEAPLKANVIADSKSSGSSSVKKVLEVGLVVLVVLLVILGLIIGFNKLKGSEEASEDESKTYY